VGFARSFVPLPRGAASGGGRWGAPARGVAGLLAPRGGGELLRADDEDPARQRIAGRVPADGSAGWRDAEWREAAATAHAVARALRDEVRMRVVLHHHAGTFVETPAEVERFLAETDPGLVGLLLDTGHYVYGGGDPVELIRRRGRRMRYVHLKDARANELGRVREGDVAMAEAWARGVFCPLGEGVVDFPRVV